MKSESIIAKDRTVLITGGTGFIGSKVVEQLLTAGFRHLRCFVRPASNLVPLQRLVAQAGAVDTVQFHTGDLLSRPDCEAAVRDVSIIYHLAAGIEKSFAGAFMNSALATRNLMEAALSTGTLKRFLNVSSFAVYSTLRLERGAVLDETCPLEDAPQKRFDAYCFGKLRQDLLVQEYGRTRQLPYVIVRPGAVFGPGRKGVSGRIAINSFGFYMHMGGSNKIPLTFVDNCAEAIVLAGLVPGIEGEVFNIVDNDLPTSREFFQAYKKVNPGLSLPMPRPLSYGLSVFWEKYSERSRGQLPPVFNRRRWSAEWKGNNYSNEKLRRRLGWQPKVKMDQAINAYLAQFKS